MLRRGLTTAVILVGAIAWVAVLVSCGYIALPGGWIINFPGFSGTALPDAELRERITLPEGFTINTWARDAGDARMLLFTEGGDLLVSNPRAGRVLLLERDRTGDGVADGQRVLLDGLYQPHGLAYRDGWLYVAETTAILRVPFDAAGGQVTGPVERIVEGLPDGGNHWTRTVHVGPDDRLYVSVGSSCNVCIEGDPRRAAILRYALDGSGYELYATGLRNAVDFAWQPGTGDLYATDNGRDLLGDDFPPCELNRVVQGGFYGWPFANAARIPDPDYGKGRDAEIAASIAPVHEFGAHTAPLGITFYEPPPGAAPAAFPARWHGTAFVAQHGSWNRSKKSGYQVVALDFAADGSITEHPFATGFMRTEQVFGRPVDVAVGPDGALYVSDDYAKVIYRIAYGTGAASPGAALPPPAVVDTPALPLADLPPAEVEAAAERGRAIWDTNPCASCHLPERAAAGAYRPLRDLQSKYTVELLASYLRTPQPPMPPVMLPEDERRDLAIYLLRRFP